MQITTDDLIGHAVHFGLKTQRWDPKMKEFIAGSSKGIHIFDVETQKQKLEEAFNFIVKTAQEGKNFLLIGTKLQVSDLTAELGKELSMPYVNHKWTPGFLTNFETSRRRIKYLHDIEQMEDSGDIEKYTKKEQSKLMKEKNDLLYALSGVKQMDKLPDVVIIIDGKKEHIALREAKNLGMHIVCFLNSNGNPDGVHYPVPGNVNAIRSLKYLLPLVKDAYARGRHLKPRGKGEETGKAQAPVAAETD